MRIKYLFVCLFKLSGKKDRNAWLRKNKIFGMLGWESNYQPRFLPSNPQLVKIHDNVRIAEGVTIYEHDGINAVFARLNGDDIDPKWRVHRSCVEIFDNCFIGGHSILIGDLKIGPNAIVAGGSVVTRDVLPGQIVAGNPAKVVGDFFELMEKRKKIDYDKPDVDEKERVKECWDLFAKKQK